MEVQMLLTTLYQSKKTTVNFQSLLEMLFRVSMKFLILRLEQLINFKFRQKTS